MEDIYNEELLTKLEEEENRLTEATLILLFLYLL